MIKKIRWLCAMLIGLLVFLAIISYVILFTHLGLRSIVKLAETFTPGILRIQETEGTLHSTVVIKNLTYYYQGHALSIEHLEFNYRLKQWFTQRRFEFGKVSLSDIKVLIANNPNATQPFQLNQLIDYINLLRKFSFDTIQVHDLIIHQGGQTRTIDSIAIEKTADHHYTVALLSSQGQLTGNVRMKRKPVFIWAINLVATHLRLNGLATGLTGEVNFSLNTQGQWGSARRHVTLTIDHVSGNIKHFPLHGAIDLEINNDEWLIKKTQLFLDNASLQLSGKSAAMNTDIDWTIRIPQLYKLYAGYQGSFLFSGKFVIKNGIYQGHSILRGGQLKTPFGGIQRIDGKITAIKPRDISHARLNLLLKNIQIKNYLIPQIQLNVITQINKSMLSACFVMALHPLNQLRGKIILPQFQQQPTLNQPLAGDITLHFSNFKNLLLTNYVKNLKGQLEGKLHLSGQLNKPQWSGSIYSLGGQFFLPPLGITLHAINLHAAIHQFQPIQLTGSVSSGQGKVAMSGWANPWQEGLPFNLQLKGDNFNLVHLKNYQIHFSPDLTVQRNNQYLNIQGKITFPFIEITTDEFNNAITLPDEVIFVHEKSRTPQIPKNLSLHVRVSLGDHVLVATKNLRARLSGNIVVSHFIGGLPTGTGELAVTEGSYKVYNQTLTINRGRLIYLGNLLSNPGLNIRALKTIKPSGWNLFAETQNSNASQSMQGGIKVGALVQGTMDTPQITLISYPPMKQDDILSYLIFDSPTEQLIGENSLSLLAGVASHLNLLNPNMSDSSNSGIGSSLFGGLQMGWFNPVQAINFRRQLTDHWMLQTQTSMVETGADLLYEYKHD